MKSDESFSFTDYRNYEFGTAAPLLPVKNVTETVDSRPSLHHGAFTTTIELNSETVIKLNRLVRTEITKGTEEERSKVWFTPRYAERFLVPKTSDEDETVKKEKDEVVRKMNELAQYKRELYEMLGKYIGDYLPEIKFFAVVDSPRRELEKSLLRARLGEEPDQELVNKIPTSEITLMEVWENVHPSDTIANQRYETLRGWFENKEFKEQLKGFAQGAYKLLLQKRMMTDISGARKGIKTVTADNHGDTLETVEQFQELVKDGQDASFALPRNMSYSQGRLKYFDTYPVMQVPPPVTEETLQKLILNLHLDNWKEIKEMIDNDQPGDLLFGVLSYLVLLKKLGADL